MVFSPVGIDFTRFYERAGLVEIDQLFLRKLAESDLPLHDRLCVAFDAELHRRLVLSNWIRTVLWTFRSVLMFRLLLQAMQLAGEAGGPVVRG